MSDAENRPLAVDDGMLVDWALGQLDDRQAALVEAAMAESEELRARGRAMARTVGLLDEHRIEPPSDGLADRIREQVAARRSGRSAGAGKQRGRWAAIFSLKEIAVVAAALLLMALVFFPSVQKARFVGQQQACQYSLRSIGVALEQYASAHGDVLPYMQLSGNWLDRADGQSATGTAPLFILVREGRLRPQDVICPATGDQPLPDDPELFKTLVDFPNSVRCSYSFQNLFDAPQPLRRGTPVPVPVLADRNPWFRGGEFRGDVGGQGNSHNHGRDAGQNVLFNDGRVRWFETPDVGLDGDNIWLAGDRRSYTGTETSRDQNDIFLAP